MPGEPMEVEQGADRLAAAPDGQQIQADRVSRFFPMEPFKFCPSCVHSFVPGTWRRIQSCTHLILVIGVIACICLVIQTIYHLIYMQCMELACIKEVVVIIFILPCTLYCVRIIGQFDDQLQSKQKQAQVQKAKLMESYQDLLADMDNLLTKSAESSAGLAERSFESKRRDFQKFLERAKKRYSVLYSGTKGDLDQLTKQFRRFCSNWLSVFEECSVDPTRIPTRVVTIAELDRCSTIEEIADLCLERLRATEVRFISSQRDQDQQMLTRERRSFTLNTQLALPSTEPEQTEAPQEARRRCGPQMTWCQCACVGCGCRMKAPDGEDWPKEARFGCCGLSVLSRDHFMLICGVCVGVFILLIETGHVFHTGEHDKKKDASNMMGVLMTVITEICLITMLLHFEDIDCIQQLEREVKKLAQQNEHVTAQRGKMKEFWGNVQQLTELWLYRTMPRLDLYKEIHSQLEDAEQEHLLMNITGANTILEELEQNLGALEAWRTDGHLTTQQKKAFSKLVQPLCQEASFDQILVMLQDITDNKMSTLQALPPSRAHQSFMQVSPKDDFVVVP